MQRNLEVGQPAEFGQDESVDLTAQFESPRSRAPSLNDRFPASELPGPLPQGGQLRSYKSRTRLCAIVVKSTFSSACISKELAPLWRTKHPPHLIFSVLRGHSLTSIQRTNMPNEYPEWPFDSPPNVACLTVRSIVDGTKPILLVTRDADDGMWQFLSGDVANTAEAMVVSLEEMILRDSTLLHLADVEPGWMAWREDLDAPWEVQAIENRTNE